MSHHCKFRRIGRCPIDAWGIPELLKSSRYPHIPENRRCPWDRADGRAPTPRSVKNAVSGQNNSQQELRSAWRDQIGSVHLSCHGDCRNGSCSHEVHGASENSEPWWFTLSKIHDCGQRIAQIRAESPLPSCNLDRIANKEHRSPSVHVRQDGIVEFLAVVSLAVVRMTTAGLRPDGQAIKVESGTIGKSRMSIGPMPHSPGAQKLLFPAANARSSIRVCSFHGWRPLDKDKSGRRHSSSGSSSLALMLGPRAGGRLWRMIFKKRLAMWEPLALWAFWPARRTISSPRPSWRPRKLRPRVFSQSKTRVG